MTLMSIARWTVSVGSRTMIRLGQPMRCTSPHARLGAAPAPRASWHECSCHGTAARSSAPHQPNLPTGTIGGVYRRHRDLLREDVEASGRGDDVVRLTNWWETIDGDLLREDVEARRHGDDVVRLTNWFRFPLAECDFKIVCLELYNNLCPANTCVCGRCQLCVFCMHPPFCAFKERNYHMILGHSSLATRGQKKHGTG